MPKSVFSDAYVSAIDDLIALRRDKSVSQVELARQLGKTQQFISLVERRERRLDVVEFCVFVRALGGDPEAAVGRILRALPDDQAI